MTATPKTLLQFLEKHRRGTLAAELATRWRELIDAVHAYRGAGSLTLTIRVKPTKNTRQLEIIPEIAVKLPKADAITGTYFVAELPEGLDLSLLDPDQDPLPGMGGPEPMPSVPLQLIHRTREEAAQ